MRSERLIRDIQNETAKLIKEANDSEKEKVQFFKKKKINDKEQIKKLISDLNKFHAEQQKYLNQTDHKVMHYS